MKLLRCKYKTLSNGGLLQNLNSEQELKIKNIIESFQTDKDNYFLYRGVDEKYLIDRFSQEKKSFNEAIILGRLFYFGDKSKNFLIERSDKNKVLKTIEACDEKTGKYIFDTFKNLKKSKNPKVVNYIENVPEINFFYDGKNKECFAKKIKLSGQLVRDYYLKILHTAGKIGVTDKSFHISSTKKYSVARGFCRDKSECYILISMYNMYMENVERETYEKTSKLLRIHELPIFSNKVNIYPEQHEFSIRAGMYPHNIFGAYNTKKDSLILNPHIFDNSNKDIDLKKEILFIDQEGFNDRLKNETNYKGWSMTNDFINYFEGNSF